MTKSLVGRLRDAKNFGAIGTDLFGEAADRIEKLERMIDRLEMLRDTMEMRIEELEASRKWHQRRLTTVSKRNAKLEKVREAAQEYRDAELRGIVGLPSGVKALDKLVEALAAREEKDDE